MTRTPIYLALGLALAALSGCVDAGGPGYVETQLVNQGPVGPGGYRPAPVYRDGPGYKPYRSTVVIDSGPRYSNRGVYREPGYGDRVYREPPYSPRQNRYDRDPYYDRNAYDRFDRNRYCSGPGYDDPRCD